MFVFDIVGIIDVALVIVDGSQLKADAQHMRDIVCFALLVDAIDICIARLCRARAKRK
jgi:hypothetical protein